MVEDKIHFIAMAIDTSNASAKRCDQIIHRRKQHIRQYGAFEMTPQSLYQVQAWTIWWQPVNFNLVPVCFKPSEYCFGLVETAVVADQSNFLAGICDYQGNQECQKIQSTFGSGYRVSNLAGSVIRHTPPVFHFCPEMELQAADLPTTIFLSVLDGGESLSHPGKPVLLGQPASSLFFQANKVFLGLLVCYFVPFAFESMLGTMDGKPFLV